MSFDNIVDDAVEIVEKGVSRIAGVVEGAAAYISVASGATIKVSTEVLKQQADAVTKEIGFLEQYFTEMEDKIKATSGYWTGEAGDNLRQIYSRKIEKALDMLRRLKEHPADLLVIAQQYEETEKANVSETNSLTGNVIE